MTFNNGTDLQRYVDGRQLYKKALSHNFMTKKTYIVGLLVSAAKIQVCEQVCQPISFHIAVQPWICSDQYNPFQFPISTQT